MLHDYTELRLHASGNLQSTSAKTRRTKIHKLYYWKLIFKADIHYLMTGLVKAECSSSKETWLIVCFLPPIPLSFSLVNYSLTTSIWLCKQEEWDPFSTGARRKPAQVAKWGIFYLLSWLKRKKANSCAVPSFKSPSSLASYSLVIPTHLYVISQELL